MPTFGEMTEVCFGEDTYSVVEALNECCEGMGIVVAGQHEPSFKSVAIKRYNLEEMSADVLTSVQRELCLMRQLQHSNISTFRSAFVIGPELWVIFSYMDYGSAADLLQTYFNDGLPESAISIIMKSVLSALEYLHKKQIIHRGVRGSHILLSSQGKVVLSGLGYALPMSSAVCYEFSPRINSNLKWLAPEILMQNLLGYDERSDLYSVGVTACELANGVPPFHDLPKTLMLLEKLEGVGPRLLDATTLPPPDGQTQDSGVGDSETTSPPNNMQFMAHLQAMHSRCFSSHFHRFVDQCVARDSEMRKSASQLLLHPFFRHSIKSPKEQTLAELLQPALPHFVNQRAQLPRPGNGSGKHTLDGVHEWSDWNF
ncbi:unnamed protein product [Darwinula stevensoni]|uniref:Protein kinase domain-containing protein n=1 Tax=Darwinula stevensoni TaxID=69355 RepID=A0A7R8XDM9_9CRUS|nr:unnamed protein product [Darwinula stevensoni]CAG0886987.1 unnamed protein product [Darwinula stevensoni]